MFDEAWKVFLDRFEHPESIFEYVCSKNHISCMSLSALQHFVNKFQGVGNFSEWHVELLNAVLKHPLRSCFVQEQLDTAIMIVGRVGVKIIQSNSSFQKNSVLSEAIDFVRGSQSKDTRKRRRLKENITVTTTTTTTKKRVRRANENVDMYDEEEVVPSWKEREETSQCASQQVGHW